MTTSREYVLTTIRSGSSGHGQSYYKAAHECGWRRAYYDQLPGFDFESSSYAAQVGIAFHAILEAYFRYPDHSIRVTEALRESPAIEEAWRIFLGYKDRYPSNSWGRVLGSELLLEPNDAVRLALGEVTARLDLVVELTEEDVLALEFLRPEVGGLEAGVYIVDFKTSQRTRNPDQYRYSIQGILYTRLWTLLHPDKPCLGVIYDCIVCHKDLGENSFYTVVQPARSDPSFVDETLRRWILHGQEVVEKQIKNPTACLDTYGKLCPLLNNPCDPYSIDQKVIVPSKDQQTQPG